MTDSGTPTLKMTITIEIDEGWQSQIDNYNHYRQASRDALKAQHDVITNPDATDKERRKAGRDFDKAAKAYSNASMSLGWAIADEMRKQGVQVNG